MDTHKSITLLLPQPPPPPPPLFNSLRLNSTSVNHISLPSKEEVNKAVIKSSFNSNCSQKIMLSFYKQVKPVIQDGPQCGLVALSMASQLLPCNNYSMQDIFLTAKNLKFTKFGEIFSAENMGILCETLLHCRVRVVTDLFLHKRVLLNHILNGLPVLIPYDADKNHEPCHRKGHSAHWATITGALLIMSPNFCCEEFTSFGIHHSIDGQLIAKYLNDANDIYFYSHHGKSKNLAIWEVNNLFSSNMNLREASPKHRKSDMIFPIGGKLCELMNKAVLLG